MKKLKTDAKIGLLTTVGMDYLQDDLLYGFRCLFGGEAIDIPRKGIMYEDFDGMVHPRSNYAMNARHFIEDPVDRSREWKPEDCDLVINLSCRRNGGHAEVHVDGEDDMVINVPGEASAKFLFKRELSHYPAPPKKDFQILPVTFGLPDHLAPLFPATGLFNSKSTEVHCSFTVEHGVNRRELARVFGNEIYETRADYIYALNEARYVLSPKGAGWDCQRHYEILGRAVPIIEVGPDAPLHFQEMWKDGENCLTFDGKPATIKDKIESVDSAQWDRMVQCGYEELMERYLCSEVARNLLERIGVL